MPHLMEGLRVLAPSLILCVGALACLLLEVSRPALRRLAGGLAIVTVIASAVSLYAIGRTPADLPAAGLLAEVRTDLLTLGFAPAFYAGALGALILLGRTLRDAGRDRAEYHALVLISTAGALLMVQARDLIVLFLALETLSIPLYVLTGFLTDRARSVESALKYFTVGAFSSAFVAFGMALTYGATGTVDFTGIASGIQDALASGATGNVMLARAGLAFLVVGFGFKVAAVPFHAWAADVYQGAPTAVTAFLGVASKAAGMGGLARLLIEAFAPLPEWPMMLAIVAAVTLVVGNCVAMLQEDVKRLIAYSGVSNAGTMLIALVAHHELSRGAAVGRGWEGGDPALSALVFYALSYALVTLGALAVVTLLEREQGHAVLVIDFAGLSQRRPGLAFAMLTFMLSLAGMPPLAGFVGKLLVFLAAVRAGWTWLAVVGAATSVVGFFYYLRIVLQMYLRPPREGVGLPRQEGHAGTWALIVLALAGVTVLGIASVLALSPLDAPVAAALR